MALVIDKNWQILLLDKIIALIDRRPPPGQTAHKCWGALKMGSSDIYIICYRSANSRPYLIAEIGALVKTHVGKEKKKEEQAFCDCQSHGGSQ